ncbi:MAG: hypothetical protein ABI581_14215, partial [Sediminibacterium sp.]
MATDLHFFIGMKKMLLVSVSLVLIISVYAQKELTMPVIPSARVLHHENITRSLNTALAQIQGSDSQKNSSDPASVRRTVTNMRAYIELNDQLDNSARFKWLRGIDEMLTGFVSRCHSQLLQPTLLPELVKAYDEAMKLDINGKSVGSLISRQDEEVGRILIENYALQGNEGAKGAKDILVRKSRQKNQGDPFTFLVRNPDHPSADSLIIRAAFRDPDAVYNYAAAPGALGRKIRSVGHPLVKTIAAMASMKTGRMYFPFLDQIYRGEIKMETIAPVIEKGKDLAYYSLLVKTRISYAERLQNRDTPVAVQALTSKLQSKAVEIFINEINALHDQTNQAVRFKKLESLSAQELYYLAVMGEEDIYTSSFVSGVYPRIIRRLHGARSDTFLEMVHHDYYRKFIKLCASYNTLDNFLSKMDDASAQLLITSFVNGLEKTNSLEDAVDVADSYSSIYDKDLRQLILDQVQLRLDETRSSHNRRGENIYHLMNTIFQSMDTAAKVDITAQLGINPVYTMPSSLLKDEKQRVIVQQFFYGDKDGQTYFNMFLGQFQNSRNWKIIKNANWVEVRSVK